MHDTHKMDLLAIREDAENVKRQVKISDCGMRNYLLSLGLLLWMGGSKGGTGAGVLRLSGGLLPGVGAGRRYIDSSTRFRAN